MCHLSRPRIIEAAAVCHRGVTRGDDKGARTSRLWSAVSLLRCGCFPLFACYAVHCCAVIGQKKKIRSQKAAEATHRFGPELVQELQAAERLRVEVTSGASATLWRRVGPCMVHAAVCALCCAAGGLSGRRGESLLPTNCLASPCQPDWGPTPNTGIWVLFARF